MKIVISNWMWSLYNITNIEKENEDHTYFYTAQTQSSEGMEKLIKQLYSLFYKDIEFINECSSTFWHKDNVELVLKQLT